MMKRIFILTVIFVKMSLIFSFDPNKEPRPEDPEIGPKGMPHNKTTSCTEFGKYARFNPYSVVYFQWFVFYYWAPVQKMSTVVFRPPTKRDTQYLRYLLQDRAPEHFNWKAPMLLLVDQLDNTTSLLVEVGDRGQYHMYIFDARPRGALYEPTLIRLKQVGPNKYIGFMVCKDHTAFILSKIEEVPRKENLQTEAAKLGYRGRKGKSYLYQGHEWMPIDEADEHEFWESYLDHYKRRYNALSA